MGLFDGKTAFIFGVANDRSIAWGIARALHREGCQLAFSYGAPALEKRVRPLAESVGSDFVELCDVTDDTAIQKVFDRARERYGSLNALVHSIAFADRRDLQGRFVDTSRDGFKMAMDISAFSLVALARAAEPLMTEGGSIITLTYYGSVKVAPQYNVMGVAKAALESCVRYLASDLGPKGIRVNAISAGPIKTLAASGVSGFKKILTYSEEASPLRTLINTEDVGNTAAWLLSDWSRGVTGEIVYVDAGWNIMGLTVPIDKLMASKDEE
jgi:enoyl-[acyl-carrier protein] reductase I